MSSSQSGETIAHPTLDGLLLDAEVISVATDDDQAVVRLHGAGTQAEAVVPLGDFRVGRSDVAMVAIGARLPVHVEHLGQDGRRWIASHDKAMRLAAFERVLATHRAGETIDGEIVGQVDGGFSVDVGVRAFLPASQVSIRAVRRPEEVLGQRCTFKIIRFDRNRQNIVVSRRVLLESERDERLGRLRQGALVEGCVRSFTEYGAFVDIGAGTEGLLHIEEMGWSRVRRPQDVVTLGDTITCKVIHLDKDKKRISLSLRQLQDDPWLSASEKYAPGTVVKGLVVSKTDYGVFVELEPGLEGLVFSTGPIVDPQDAAKLGNVDIGDDLAAKVVDINLETKRLSMVLA
ncbi:MAG: S1 RNA-binding domain-containing protein [Myxococcales bacterium]|nr:S1 RNA-binding domain-containing protein [Myxococcales bacterium]